MRELVSDDRLAVVLADRAVELDPQAARIFLLGWIVDRRRGRRRRRGAGLLARRLRRGIARRRPGALGRLVGRVLLHGLVRLGHRDVDAEVEAADAVAPGLSANELVAHAELEAERDPRPDHVLEQHGEDDTTAEQRLSLRAERLDREPQVAARQEAKLPQRPRLQDRRDVRPHHQQMNRVLVARPEQQRRVGELATDGDPLLEQRASTQPEQRHRPWHDAIRPEVREREQVAVHVGRELELRLEVHALGPTRLREAEHQDHHE